MLEVDPDVILHKFGVASYYDVEKIRKTLGGPPGRKQLTAVKNDAVYPSGNPVQGPLMNLFQLEMTAKQLYPEQFGEWPEYENGESVPGDSGGRTVVRPHDAWRTSSQERIEEPNDFSPVTPGKPPPSRR